MFPCPANLTSYGRVTSLSDRRAGFGVKSGLCGPGIVFRSCSGIEEAGTGAYTNFLEGYSRLAIALRSGSRCQRLEDAIQLRGVSQADSRKTGWTCLKLYIIGQ